MRDDTVAAAEAAAARAAAVVGARVDEVHGVEAVAAACRLIDATWATVEVPIQLAVAIVHAGGYVATATAGGEVVGASVGFVGTAGGLHLHSHVTAVAEGLRGGGIGYAVKLHQRAWALARDIPVVSWTYDPMRAANARFNLVKLGADAVALHLDFYGAMDDLFNAGDLTDRLEVRWDLASPRAVAAAAGRPEVLDDAALVAAGAAVVLDAGPGGEPVVAGPAGPGLPRLVAVPRDAAAVAAEPARQRAWRTALREALGDGLAGGLAIAGFTAGGRYLLAPAGEGSRPSR
jgi:predicted GNAT superfamily acetyltransferase